MQFSTASVAPSEIELRLVVDPELGAGLETDHTWWGLRVTVVDEEPGQTGLSVGDTITSIGGCSLAEVEDECAANDIFKAGFFDRALITVATQRICAVNFPLEAKSWPESFRADLELIGERCQVGVTIYSHMIEVVGPSTAMDFTKGELQDMFNWYASSSTPIVVNFNVIGQHNLSPVRLDPYKIRFTHDKISSHFRNGTRVDETIADIISGRLDPHALPHLELTEYNGSIYSLSNRRLFVFRVLRSLGKVAVAHGILHPWHSEAVQRVKLDIDTGLELSKWERSFSTSNGGQFVHVRSEYERFQCPQ